MENFNNPRTNSYDEEPLKADAAPGNQTETFTVKVPQSQNSHKRKMSECSCVPGKQKRDYFFSLLLISTFRD